MALTNKQVYDLNNMNVAAQNAKLGDLLKNGASAYTLPAANKTTLGGVKMAAAVADAAATNVTKEEFNALLAALRAAGIVSAS